MNKILVVSHCVLNTSSKVLSYNEAEQREEEEHRRRLLEYVIENNIQLIQLPCPEFIMYGAKRWGHGKEQFSHPFFRNQCRSMLQSVVMQLKEYAAYPERFQLLAIVAIDNSPSCAKIGNNLIDKIFTCVLAFFLIKSLPVSMKSTLKSYNL